MKRSSNVIAATIPQERFIRKNFAGRRAKVISTS